MKLSRFMVVAALVSAPLVGSGSVSAAGFDPGDFKVNVTSGGMSAPRAATVCSAAGQSLELRTFLDNIVSKWNGQGAPPSATCTQESSAAMTNAALSGTVTNATVGDGTIEQTCDIKRTVTISYTLTLVQGSPNLLTVGNFANAMQGYQACTWAMAFRDAKSSRLSGSIEQSFGFTSSGTVPCNNDFSDMKSMGTLFCIEVNADAKVWVVGGSGEFADTGGTGAFSNTSLAPVVIPAVSGVTVQSLRNGLVIEGLDELLVRAADPNALKVTLVRGAKASVRLVSPPKAGSTRTLGLGADGSTPLKVKLSAAPGAKCSVSGTAGSRSKTLVAAKKDTDGMISTSITSASLKSQMKVSSGAKVLLSVYCAVGTKKASSSQSVTLDG